MKHLFSWLYTDETYCRIKTKYSQNIYTQYIIENQKCVKTKYSQSFVICVQIFSLLWAIYF